MKRSTLAALMVVALVATACSGSITSDDVRSFSEIAQADPVIDFDPSGTAATVLVTTNQAAVCAVAYGTDGPFGAIATDQDMGAGGGHDDHSALMTGLQPDTEYQYRLQGVGADGLLYRSETMTFRTPEAQTSDLGANLALGATVVAVSSEFSDAFSAANAIDGDIGTEWSTRGDGDDASITIDLGQTTDVTAIAFRTRSMGDGTAITSTYTVEADGEVYGPFPAGPEPSEVSFAGQVLTFDVRASSGGNTGAIEIEVYGG